MCMSSFIQVSYFGQHLEICRDQDNETPSPSSSESFNGQSAQPERGFQQPIEGPAPELVSHVASYLGPNEQLFLGLSSLDLYRKLPELSGFSRRSAQSCKECARILANLWAARRPGNREHWCIL